MYCDALGREERKNCRGGGGPDPGSLARLLTGRELLHNADRTLALHNRHQKLKYSSAVDLKAAHSQKE